MNKATVKFNGGRLALLCSGCSVIIKTGAQFTMEEMDQYFQKKSLPAQWCDRCQEKKHKTTT